MRSILLWLLSASLAVAATGDILSVTVRDDGWSADVEIEGLSTGGIYDFGWDATANPATSTPKITFTVVSLGYDDAGAVTTNTRTVYGAKQVRKPYPDEAQNDESISGSDVIIRIALSDYIYQKDATGAGNSGTAPVVNILGGFYTQGGTPNNATGAGFAVTNSSTAAHQQVVGGWYMPPFQKVGSTFQLRAGAFHRHAQSGRPVRAVKFTVTDGSNTVTETVTTMTISNDDGDAVNIPEYIATIDTSTLTQGAVLTCDMQQFPWVGDEGSVLDTSASGYTMPDPRHAPLPLLLDKTGGYGTTMALVDASTGNDGTGQAYDSASYNAGTAAKFLTIAAAVKAIRDYNNSNRSRGDAGGGVVELNAGSYQWMGATLGSVYGTTPNTWLTVRPAVGVARSDVIIAGDTGDPDPGDRLHIQNVTITATASGTFSGIAAVWWDNCLFNTTNTALLRTGVHWITQGKVTQLAQGLRPFSTEVSSLALIRGVEFAGLDGEVIGHTVIGNYKPAAATGKPRFTGDFTGQGGPAPQSQILAYNRILDFDVGGAGSTYMMSYAMDSEAIRFQRGLAFVQNLFERTGTSGSAIVAQIGTGSTQGTNNVLAWHNTLVGQRQNFAYNDTGTTSIPHKFWSLKNNILWDYNIKSDVFPSGSGNRTGNWSTLYGVGFSGNVLADESNSFDNEFSGLGYWAGNFNGPDSATTFDFTDYQANEDVTGGSGGGTYTLLSTSPAYELQVEQVLSHDIAGNERGATDSAGAYTTYEAPAGPTSTINATTTNATTLRVQ